MTSTGGMSPVKALKIISSCFSAALYDCSDMDAYHCHRSKCQHRLLLCTLFHPFQQQGHLCGFQKAKKASPSAPEASNLEVEMLTLIL